MACRLGCDPGYEALIRDRCTGTTITGLDFSDLTWQRTLDGVSEASVFVPASADCCGKLAGVRPWRHELAIVRNGESVWEGPLTLPSYCRSGIRIEARDFLYWLGGDDAGRVIHNDLCFDPDCGGAAATGPTIAAALIRDGFAPDDPCVLDYLMVIDGGDLQERFYTANSAYTLDALTDLARGGVDFTAVGRRIIVMPEGHALGRTAMLSCDAFGGDLCVTDDGPGAATRAVVTGKAPDGETVVSGAAGGVDAYFGLVERLLDDETVKTAAAAAAQAGGLLRNPPPLLVQAPQGSGLAPEAPVCVSELVPGVEVPVLVDCACREAAQIMRLTRLDVSVDADGETVAPLLQPVSTATT